MKTALSLCICLVLLTICNAEVGPPLRRLLSLKREEAALTPQMDSSVAAAELTAPNTLESFLESGAHSEAELEAVAKAQVDALLAAESQSQSELSVESAASSSTNAGVDMSAAAGGGTVEGATSAAVAGAEAVLDAESGKEHDNIIKVLYNELKKMGTGRESFDPASAAATAASSVSDPRISRLEKTLAGIERKRIGETNRAQDLAITGINERLGGLDKTLQALKQSAAQQQALANQLLRAAQSSADSRITVTADESVIYEKATLPSDFEIRVQQILESVQTEARKIYELYCKRKPKIPNTDPTATPLKYPKEKTPKLKSKRKPTKKSGTAPKPASQSYTDRAAASANAPPRPKHKKSKVSAVPMGGAPPQPQRSPARKPRVPKPKSFKPIIKGKEPTPEGLRLAKAINDVQKALPVIPAYHLGDKAKALQDVLGEDAVSARQRNGP
jgi:hypothetical protein